MKTTRREFIKKSASTLAALAVAPVGSVFARPKLAGTTYLPYPDQKIASFDEIKTSGQMAFTFPDDSSPCLAIYVPDAGVVAYSLQCPHTGCPVLYQPEAKVFECTCHFSRFDAEKNAQEICGQATVRLPRIELEVKDNDVYAVGVDGLIFGRVSNILDLEYTRK
ncbi:MAG: arsenate reductase (azurin) small subunit [bacterium]